MSINSLPIWRDNNRFLLSVEQIVLLILRSQEYGLNSELRKNALEICNLIHKARRQKFSNVIALNNGRCILTKLKFSYI